MLQLHRGARGCRCEEQVTPASLPRPLHSFTGYHCRPAAGLSWTLTENTEEAPSRHRPTHKKQRGRETAEERVRYWVTAKQTGGWHQADSWQQPPHLDLAQLGAGRSMATSQPRQALVPGLTGSVQDPPLPAAKLQPRLSLSPCPSLLQRSGQRCPGAPPGTAKSGGIRGPAPKRRDPLHPSLSLLPAICVIAPRQGIQGLWRKKSHRENLEPSPGAGQ